MSEHDRVGDGMGFSGLAPTAQERAQEKYEEVRNKIAQGRERQLAELAIKNRRLIEALTRLSNEVIGSLPLMELDARQMMGYAVLMQRAEEARALVATLTAAK